LVASLVQGLLRRPVALDQQVHVLEQTATSDQLGLTGDNGFLAQVLHGLPEVAKQTDGADLAGQLCDHFPFFILILVAQQPVQVDLERVDTELKLAAHPVDKLELDAPAVVVVQGDQ